MRPVDKPVDLGAFYRVEGYDGIAWTLIGHPTRPAECQGHLGVDIGVDGETVEVEVYCNGSCEEPATDTTQVIAVMVGDDRKFTFDVDELHELGESEFCHGCGQIGCGH